MSTPRPDALLQETAFTEQSAASQHIDNNIMGTTYESVSGQGTSEATGSSHIHEHSSVEGVTSSSDALEYVQGLANDLNKIKNFTKKN